VEDGGEIMHVITETLAEIGYMVVFAACTNYFTRP